MRRSCLGQSGMVSTFLPSFWQVANNVVQCFLANSLGQSDLSIWHACQKLCLVIRAQEAGLVAYIPDSSQIASADLWESWPCCATYSVISHSNIFTGPAVQAAQADHHQWRIRIMGLCHPALLLMTPPSLSAVQAGDAHTLRSTRSVPSRTQCQDTPSTNAAPTSPLSSLWRSGRPAAHSAAHQSS